MCFEIALPHHLVTIVTWCLKGNLLDLLSVHSYASDQWLQEAYGGFSSAFIWLLVLHSAQREIRERNHYSVDCVVAIYVGILLWKVTGFLWPANDTSRGRRINILEKIQSRLTQAAKDDNMDEVRELLREVELVSLENQNKAPSKAMWLFGCGIVISAITIVLLALILTSDG